jgi:integrase
MGEVIRKTWPKIRLVVVKGDTFYQVDGRKKGTKGKREHFSTKAEAEERAREIEGDFRLEGIEGLALSAELRVEALKAETKLKPHGKTVMDAVNFYVAHLEAEKEKQNSATVHTLSEEWHKAKKAQLARGILRDRTVSDIRATAGVLQKQFGSLRIAEMTTEHFQKYLDSLEIKQQTFANIRSQFSQFFNWCIEKGYTSENPLKKIGFDKPKRDVQILTPKEARRLMAKVESEFTHLTIYHAVCLFAGLRPTEAKLLKWEDIHLDELQITVWQQTSKVKETRNVQIEDTLLYWLKTHTGTKSGFIVKQKGFRTATEKFRIALGYKIGKENKDGPTWVEDILRHSYASYWLPKYNHRGLLAEQMGNSIKTIKKHYKRIVKTSEVDAFWSILPQAEQERREAEKAEVQKRLTQQDSARE